MKNKKTYELVLLALLLAIELIFAFTPLGYLRVGIVEITFMTLPIAISAMLINERASLILGCVFGLTSFIQCFGISPFGTTLCTIDPLRTFVLCFIPRALMGYLSGLIFKLVSRIDKKKILSFIASAFSAAFLNTLFFLLTFILLFGNESITIGEETYDIAKMSIIQIVVFIVGVNGLIEAGVCTVVSAAIGRAISPVIDKIKRGRV